MGKNVSESTAGRAAAPIVEGLVVARDLNQIVFLARALESFRQRSGNA